MYSVTQEMIDEMISDNKIIQQRINEMLFAIKKEYNVDLSKEVKKILEREKKIYRGIITWKKSKI